MAGPQEEGGLKEVIDTYNNITISDSTLLNILPLQLKKMTSQYKVMCVCECFIYSKIMHSSLLTWRNRPVKHLKYRSHNVKNRRYGEISSRIFETYKNAVRPRFFCIYNTTAYMAMETMCPCTSIYHGLPHWECVLHCCDKCPSISLTGQGGNKDTTNICPTIQFHVYRHVSYCTVHEQRPYHKRTTFSLCSTVTRSDRTIKVYTQKERVLLETSITEFYEKNYIPNI